MSEEDYSSNQALVVLPKELRIERKVSNALRASVTSWLPVAFLAPLAFVAEVAPAAIGILVMVGLTLRELRRDRSDVMPELELADSGDIEEATLHVAQMAKGERDWRRKTFLLGVLSHLELRAGNPESALALARESVRMPIESQPVLQRSLNSNLAMILMLNGQDEEAMLLLPESPTPDPVTDTYRLVVWGLAEKWQEVADYKYVRMPQMQGLRHNNRVMALVKALSLAQTGGGALKLQRYLDEAKPRLDEEFSYLSSRWPALKAFIAEHPDLRARRSILERA